MLAVRRLAIVLLLLLALAPHALGDSAPMATVGPGVEPMESTTVRLAEERIEIHLSRQQSDPAWFFWDAVGEFRIWFRFEPEADEEMTVGFPLFVIDPEQSIYGARIEDLRVEVDGREVPVEIRPSAYGKENPDADPADWAVYPVSFRAGQPLEMVISYTMPVAPYGKRPDSPLWVSYVLRTGAYWAGTIGRAEAAITMDRPIREADVRTGDNPWRSTTPGWTLEDGALKWVWEDVEPDFDLHLVMENPYWLDLDRDIRALLDEGPADRETLLRVLSGTAALYAGGRDGEQFPLRDGVMSDEAGEALLPDVLAAAQSYLAEQPEDREVWEAYLDLLCLASVEERYDATGPVHEVRDEQRLATALTELARYAREAELPGYRRQWRPWMAPELAQYPWQPETQAAIADFLAAAMPPLFRTAADAEEWVASNARSALTDGQVEELLAQAMERVSGPVPQTASEGEATDGGAATSETETGGTATVTGEGSSAVVLLILGLCLALGAAGTAMLWAWRRARRRAEQPGR